MNVSATVDDCVTSEKLRDEPVTDTDITQLSEKIDENYSLININSLSKNPVSKDGIFTFPFTGQYRNPLQQSEQDSINSEQKNHLAF